MACGAPSSEQELVGAEEQRFSSNQATLLDFEFDGELYVTGSAWSPKAYVDEQLLYTIGHLNGNKSVGRLDTVQVTQIQKSSQEDGTTRITYRAKLPVAWGSKTNLPTSYDFVLPRKLDSAGLQAFTEAYSRSCVDGGAHDVTTGDMWYYFRPKRSGCTIAEADVVKLKATVTVSTENTTGRYPEYHKVWEDDVLEVVAIFGKYEDDATSNSDAGISAYNRFAAAMKSALSGASPRHHPGLHPLQSRSGDARHQLRGHPRRWSQGEGGRAAGRQRPDRRCRLPGALRGAVHDRRRHHVQRPRRARLERPGARAHGPVRARASTSCCS